MTSSVRILTTYTLDSSPSILLVAPNGDKTLINCGEGCQRSFLESPGLKVRSVTRVCLTHLGHDAVGGLPGMVLTTADVSESILASVVQEDTGVADFPSVKRKDHPEQPLVGASVDDTPPDLVVVGPTGTQAFLHSLRHFMRRDKFRMTVRQGEYCQMQGENVPSVRSKSNKRSRKELSGDASNSTSEEGFLVQTIPTKQYSGDSNHDEREILSFVFTTPRVKGKFLPDKASELGVPRGPMFAKLKSGRSVSFVDASGNEQTVHSHEVVEKAGPCVAVAVLYCPSLYVLAQLQQSSVVNSLFRYAGDSHVLDMVLHLVPEPLFRSREYGVFRERFYHGTDHVWLETYSNLTSVGSRMMSVRHEPSPFQAAVLGAQTRSMLNDDIYLSVQTRGYEPGDSDIPKVMKGRSRTEYTLIPRSKKGFTEKPPPTKSEVSSVLEQKKITDSTFIANVVSGVHCTSTCPTMQGQAIANSTLHFAGELIFTGTGSALPCKHRNVTGIYMQMSNGKSLLLDVGEGTVGQILRAKRDEVCYDQLLCRIKAVWISHPHADHHLGLLRLLSERNPLRKEGAEPLVLIAPQNLFRFLAEYSLVHPEIRDSYVPLDCEEITKGKTSPILRKLTKELGIAGCIAVPVAHCPHSYAIVMDGTPFGRTAYSGDCRPSLDFAKVGVDADLLIHESTFEDGMEKEAVLKRHCTVGEALEVAKKMRAKHVVLTHFSQRYPRIPPLRATNSQAPTGSQIEHERVPSVSFAFDFMRLRPETLNLSSQLTPALRCLYPAADSSDLAEEEAAVTNASRVLSVPGLFARKELL